MRNVLFPIDASKVTREAFERTLKNLSPNEDKVHLLHVIQVTENASATNQRFNNADKILSEAMHQCELHGFQVGITKSVTGNTVEEICLFADSHNIELIIIASQGKQGIAKFFMGSVSQSLF